MVYSIYSLYYSSMFVTKNMLVSPVLRLMSYWTHKIFWSDKGATGSGVRLLSTQAPRMKASSRTSSRQLLKRCKRIATSQWKNLSKNLEKKNPEHLEKQNCWQWPKRKLSLILAWQKLTIYIPNLQSCREDST